MLMISEAVLSLIDHRNEKFDSVFPEVIRSDQHLVAQGIDLKIDQLLNLLLTE
jgi:hypothetical protein